MLCFVAAYLLTALLVAWLGGKISESYDNPWIAGVFVGLVFHLPGVLVLWLVLLVLPPNPRRPYS